MSDDHDEAVTEVAERHEDPAGATADQETAAEGSADNSGEPDHSGPIPRMRGVNLQASLERMRKRVRRQQAAESAEPVGDPDKSQDGDSAETGEAPDQGRGEDPDQRTEEEIRAYQEEMARLTKRNQERRNDLIDRRKANQDALMERKAASAEAPRAIPNPLPMNTRMAIGGCLDFLTEDLAYELTEIFGVDDAEFAASLMDQILEVHPMTPVPERWSHGKTGFVERYKEVAGFIRALEPSNGAEAVKAAHAAIAHFIAIGIGGEMRRSAGSPHVAGQLFSRWKQSQKMSGQAINDISQNRRAGTQHVTVEHKTIVESGGQAVVGVVGGQSK